MKLPKLILASGSPRRSEILTSVGWEFAKDSADIDETELPGEAPEDYVRRLALEKAETVAAKYDSGLILGADTTVVIAGQIIGKPADEADARRMLQMLSGSWHDVLTGVALVGKEEEKKRREEGEKASASLNAQPRSSIRHLRSVVGLQRTGVKFSSLTDQEIEYLIRFGEPLDKAGAYAVQAQAALFIEEIRGDYWNVVGLPISLVYRLVEEMVD